MRFPTRGNDTFHNVRDYSCRGTRARGLSFLIILTIAIGSLLVSASSCGTPSNGESVLLPVSCSSSGELGDASSNNPSLSSDGRYIAFESAATNFVDIDSSAGNNVFRKDLETGEILLCSLSENGELGNGYSSSPSISADGRYVAFVSGATNLVPGDNNGCTDIFRKDLQTGEIVRCSTASDGTEITIDSELPSISGDGRYVAFDLYTTGDIGKYEGGIWVYNMYDVYCKDTVTGELIFCNISQSGEPGNGDSMVAVISSDGRYVAFGSNADNLLPQGDPTEIPDFTADVFWYWNVFRKDLVTGEVVLCSASAGGEPARDFTNCRQLSPDGRYILFSSHAANLVPGDSNEKEDAFLKDLETGEIVCSSTSANGELGDENSEGVSMTSDARNVALQSTATNLVPVETATPGWGNIFLKDLETGEIVFCSSLPAEMPGHCSGGGAISSDGRYVTISITGDPPDSLTNIYRRELPI